MKKSLLSLFVLCCTSMSTLATPIYFSVNIIDTHSIGHQHPRSPMRPPQAPEASLDSHTLSIGEHPDFLLQLLNCDETVVFETYLPSSVYEVQLPENITGDFELQLQTDNVTFIGEIEL